MQQEQAQAVLRARQQRPTWPIAYFGYAPIPLCVHLGRILSEVEPVEVYQRHHSEPHRRWAWRDARPGEASRFRVDVPISDPEPAALSVALRLSTSHPVALKTVLPAFEGSEPPPLHVAVSSTHTDKDCFRSRAEFDGFCQQLDEFLDDVASRAYAANELRLFAAIQCGVAFRIGAKHSLSRLPIQTYQYARGATPPYFPALHVGAHQPASVLLLTAEANGFRCTTGRQEVQEIMDLLSERPAVAAEAVIMASARTLNNRLRTDRPTVVYFAGHGVRSDSAPQHGPGFDRGLVETLERHDALVMSNERGEPRYFKHDDLIDAVRSCRSIRTVVLSCCYGAPLVRRLIEETQVEHAFGFCGLIDDTSAREFGVALLQASCDGDLPTDALRFARRHLNTEHRPGADQIVHEQRPGARSRPLIA